MSLQQTSETVSAYELRGKGITWLSYETYTITYKLNASDVLHNDL